MGTRFDESLRPQFHFTAPTGWLNDPNGLVYFRGEWHLFYQHNPHGTDWGNMTWGHALSRDLVHWQHLPLAVRPDARGTVFSGSAVVDRNGDAGFGKNALLAFYTAAGGTSPESQGQPFTQCLAFSTDRGRTWTKYAGNPVVENLSADDRDPKVFRCDDHWTMALYVPRDEVRGIEFLTSTDLKSWRVASRVEGFYECPDCFPLGEKWALFGADGDTLLGDFDGAAFTPDGEKRKSNWGPNYYAAQTYSDVPASDGRRVLIAWMNGGKYPGMPFNQQMTFPVALSLRRFAEGWRLCRQPVREIRALWAEETRLQIVVSPGANPLAGISGDLWDIDLTLAPRGADAVTLTAAAPPVRIDFAAGEVVALGRAMPLERERGKFRLRALIDRTSLELYASRGSVFFAGCFVPEGGDRSLALTAEGGAVSVDLRLRRLRAAVSPR